MKAGNRHSTIPSHLEQGMRLQDSRAQLTSDAALVIKKRKNPHGAKLNPLPTETHEMRESQSASSALSRSGGSYIFSHSSDHRLSANSERTDNVTTANPMPISTTMSQLAMREQQSRALILPKPMSSVPIVNSSVSHDLNEVGETASEPKKAKRSLQKTFVKKDIDHNAEATLVSRPNQSKDKLAIELAEELNKQGKNIQKRSSPSKPAAALLPMDDFDATLQTETLHRSQQSQQSPHLRTKMSAEPSPVKIIEEPTMPPPSSSSPLSSTVASSTRRQRQQRREAANNLAANDLSESLDTNQRPNKQLNVIAESPQGSHIMQSILAEQQAAALRQQGIQQRREERKQQDSEEQQQKQQHHSHDELIRNVHRLALLQRDAVQQRNVSESGIATARVPRKKTDSMLSTVSSTSSMESFPLESTGNVVDDIIAKNKLISQHMQSTQLQLLQQSDQLSSLMQSVIEQFEALQTIQQDVFIYRKEVAHKVETINNKYLSLFQTMLREVMQIQRTKFKSQTKLIDELKSANDISAHALQEMKLQSSNAERMCKQWQQEAKDAQAQLQQERKQHEVEQKEWQRESSIRLQEKDKFADFQLQEHERQLRHELQRNFARELRETIDNLKLEYESKINSQAIQIEKLKMDSKRLTNDLTVTRQSLDASNGNSYAFIRDGAGGVTSGVSGKNLRQSIEQVSFRFPSVDASSQTYCDELEEQLWDRQQGWTLLPVSKSQRVRDRWRSLANAHRCLACRGSGRFVSRLASLLRNAIARGDLSRGSALDSIRHSSNLTSHKKEMIAKLDEVLRDGQYLAMAAKKTFSLRESEDLRYVDQANVEKHVESQGKARADSIEAMRELREREFMIEKEREEQQQLLLLREAVDDMDRDNCLLEEHGFQSHYLQFSTIHLPDSCVALLSHLPRSIQALRLPSIQWSVTLGFAFIDYVGNRLAVLRHNEYEDHKRTNSTHAMNNNERRKAILRQHSERLQSPMDTLLQWLSQQLSHHDRLQIEIIAYLLLKSWRVYYLQSHALVLCMRFIGMLTEYTSDEQKLLIAWQEQGERALTKKRSLEQQLLTAHQRSTKGASASTSTKSTGSANSKTKNATTDTSQTKDMYGNGTKSLYVEDYRMGSTAIDRAEFSSVREVVLLGRQCMQCPTYQGVYRESLSLVRDRNLDRFDIADRYRSVLLQDLWTSVTTQSYSESSTKLIMKSSPSPPSIATDYCTFVPFDTQPIDQNAQGVVRGKCHSFVPLDRVVRTIYGLILHCNDCPFFMRIADVDVPTDSAEQDKLPDNLPKPITIFSDQEVAHILRRLEDHSFVLGSDANLTSAEGQRSFLRSMIRVFQCAISENGADIDSWKELGRRYVCYDADTHNCNDCTTVNENHRKQWLVLQQPAQQSILLADIDFASIVIVEILCKRKQAIESALRDCYNKHQSRYGLQSWSLQNFTHLIDSVRLGIHCPEELQQMYLEALQLFEDSDEISCDAFLHICWKFRVVELIDIHRLERHDLAALTGNLTTLGVEKATSMADTIAEQEETLAVRLDEPNSAMTTVQFCDIACQTDPVTSQDGHSRIDQQGCDDESTHNAEAPQFGGASLSKRKGGQRRTQPQAMQLPRANLNEELSRISAQQIIQELRHRRRQRDGSDANERYDSDDYDDDNGY